MNAQVRSNRPVVGSLRVLFCVLAAAAFSALVVMGCSEKPDNKFCATDEQGNAIGNEGCEGDGKDTIITPPDTIPPPDTLVPPPSNGLVLGSNEAWVMANEYYTIAYIFKANGDLAAVVKRTDGNWYDVTTATLEGNIKWSTKGDTIVMTLNGELDKTPYSISGNGNTLTMTDTYEECDWDPDNGECIWHEITRPQVYTKTTIPAYTLLNDIATGGNPVLGDGEAWVTTSISTGSRCWDEECEDYTDTSYSGYIYKANNDYIEIDYSSWDESWSGYKRGTWKRDGKFLVITHEYGDGDTHVERELFSVSGNTLTIHNIFEDYVYTKTQVGEIEIYDYSHSMYKSPNAKKRLPEKPFSGKTWGLLPLK